MNNGGEKILDEISCSTDRDEKLLREFENSLLKSSSPSPSFLETLELQRSSVCFSSEELSKKPRLVRQYYESQAELVQFQREIDAKLVSLKESTTTKSTSIPCDTTTTTTTTTTNTLSSTSDDTSITVPREIASTLNPDTPKVAFAINASASVNVILLIVKLYAAATSGSVAVAASAVDSMMDLISGLILWVSSLLSSKRDSLGFPVGKNRFETIAIVLFSSIMGFASLTLIREGTQSLAAGPISQGTDISTLGIIAGVVLSKSMLFWLCTSLRTVSPTCGALALDHLNDVMTNSATLLAIGVASRFKEEAWWLDPAACILLSVIMLRIWFKTGLEHVRLLISVAASSLQLSKLTYIAYTHPALYVDTVMAYYIGARVQVEVDIVLPAKLPLNRAHDIGEALTLRLEAHEDVERAFVHLDTEFDHMRAIEHVDPYTKDL